MVRTNFERRSGDGTQVDGVCEFEKVPPDLSVRVRVRVRVRVGLGAPQQHGMHRLAIPPCSKDLK